ncbi:MAG: S1 family peptidase [Firmicutes bacterium]|nr:S1 family peptidase [Bacillota bacterium]
MMFFKRFRIIVLAFLITSLLFTQRAFADESTSSPNIADVTLDESAIAAPSENVYVLCLNQANVLQELGISVAKEDSSLQNNQIHLSDYGGAYIDAEGNVNVLLIDGSSSLDNIAKDPNRNISKKVIKNSDQSKNNKKVKLKEVKFTEADLLSVCESLTGSAVDLSIGAWYVDIPSNQVVVQILDGNKDKENNITKFVTKNAKVKSKQQVSESLRFEYITQDDLPVLTSSSVSPTT